MLHLNKNLKTHLSNKEAIGIYFSTHKEFARVNTKEDILDDLNIVDPDGFNDYTDEEFENKLMFRLIMLVENHKL